MIRAHHLRYELPVSSHCTAGHQTPWTHGALQASQVLRGDAMTEVVASRRVCDHTSASKVAQRVSVETEVSCHTLKPSLRDTCEPSAPKGGTEEVEIWKQSIDVRQPEEVAAQPLTSEGLRPDQQRRFHVNRPGRCTVRRHVSTACR